MLICQLVLVKFSLILVKIVTDLGKINLLALILVKLSSILVIGIPLMVNLTMRLHCVACGCVACVDGNINDACREYVACECVASVRVRCFGANALRLCEFVASVEARCGCTCIELV